MPPAEGSADYVTGERFRFDVPPTSDADADLVALAGGDRVVLVTAADTTAVDLDAPVAAVAVDRYVVVATEEGVRALTRGGVTLWTRETTGVVGLAPVRGRDVVVALVGDDLVGMDSETGNELFRVTRPHTDLEPDGLFGAAWGVTVPAWSYLTGFDARGEELFDVNLDGTVESVGTLSDRAVVGLRDGDAVAVTADGHRAWRRTLDARRFAPAGDQRLPAVTGSGPVLVDDDGETSPLPVGDDPDAVYCTYDGTVCCTVTGVEATVHRRLDTHPESVTAEVLSEEVGLDDPLRVRLTNEGEAAVLASVGVDVEGASTDATDERVSLAPEASHDLSVEVTGVREPELAVGVRAGERTVAEREVTVSGSTPEEALEATAELVGVEDGTVTFAVEATNGAGRPVERVRVSPPGKSLPPLEPGETRTVEQSTSFRPGWSGTVRVEGRVGPDEVSAEADVSIPDPAFDCTVERGGDRDRAYADVTLRNHLPVPVEDVLRVRADGRELERRVTVAAGSSFTLALPVDSPAVEAVVPGVECRVETELSGLSASEPAPASERGPDPGQGGEPEPTPEVGVDETGEIDLSVLEAGAEATLRVSREAGDGLVGYAVREELAVRNDGSAPAGDVTVSVGGAAWTADAIAPGEELRLVRFHLPDRAGTFEIDGGSVEHADGRLTVDPVTADVRSPDVRTEATLESGDREHELSVTVENDRDDAVRVTRVVADLGDERVRQWTDDRLGPLASVPPGERATVAWTVPAEECDVDGSPVRVGLSYEPPDGEERRRTTLATPSRRSERPIDVRVVEGSDLEAGAYGFVTLSVENTAGRPITDLGVEASHDALTSTYLPSTDERLAADDRLRHDVDISPDRSGSTSIDVVVEGVAGDERFSERLAVSGPIAERGGWSESLLEEWSVSVEEAETTSERPRRPATDYVREGSRR